MAIRRRRDPNAPAFEEGLPVFLCGGGARIDFYREVVEEVNRRFLTATAGTRPFHVMVIERPEALVDERVDEDLYARLAVAYGLSFDKFNIGEIISPAGILDMPAVPDGGGNPGFVGPEQV